MTTCGKLQNGGEIVIVGAGPGGATLGRLLSLRGCSVRILERDASPTARPQGGSLDLRPDSGQLAINKAGLSSEFAGRSRAEAKAFRMTDSAGNELPGVGEEMHDNAGPEIDRGALRLMLLDSLPAGMVAWDHEVEHVEQTVDRRWRLDVKGRESLMADLVIGADGIGSKVRQRLTGVQPIYTGITMIAANIRRDLWRGSTLSNLLGEGSVMFAGGNKTIFVQRCSNDLILLYYSMSVPQGWPKTGGFDLNDTGAVIAAVRDAYRDWSPGVLDMLTQVHDGFQLWPTSVIPPGCRWETQPGLTMLGDAAHVMPPFTGKGVNLALLDALELSHALTDDPGRKLSDAIQDFEHRMQVRTDREVRSCLRVGREAYGMELGFDLELGS